MRPAGGVEGGDFEAAIGREEIARGVEFHFITRQAQGGFDVGAVRASLPDDDGTMGGLLAVRLKGQRLSDAQVFATRSCERRSGSDSRGV